MAKLQVGINDLFTWCKNNGEWGQRLIDEWVGQYEDGTPVKMDEIARGSNKRVRWNCRDCDNHWSAQINTRVRRKAICPKCCIKNRGNAVSKGMVVAGNNDLLTWCNSTDLGKSVLADWTGIDTDGNKVEMSDIAKGSSRKLKWICSKHKCEYISTVYDRVYRNQGCKQCGKERIKINNMTPNDGESLADRFPNIASEWFDTESGLSPKDVKCGSKIKAVWKCKVCGYVWEATVAHRTYASSGCPKCAKAGTSYPEQYLYRALKQVFDGALSRAKLFENIEYDIVIPEIKLCIEYSAEYYHIDREQKDRYKREISIKNGYTFLEIVESNNIQEDYYELWSMKICTKGKYYDKDTQLKNILAVILKQYGHTMDEIDFDKVKKEAEEFRGLKIDISESIVNTHPELLNEWDYNKNKEIGYNPENFRSGNHTKVFWKCKLGHSWEDTISHRTTNGRGCPICSNKTVLVGYNDLATTHPELAKEWHNDNKLTAMDIVAGHNKKIKWKCTQCNHIWETAPSSRTIKGRESGCPNCGYNWYKAQTGQPQKLKKSKVDNIDW